MPIDKSNKRLESLTTKEVQEGSALWWTKKPMLYDWHDEIEAARFTSEWFDAIDARFLFGSRLFASTHRPFDQILPIDNLDGAKVLEIGCGMGLHTQTMTSAGANVTAVDLTPTAVEATVRRLALKGLRARILQCDAEDLPFDSRSFDFVWSWGVIHHSSRTARIVREIARVLNQNGECRVMVYNRHGMAARVGLIRDHIFKAGFVHRTFEETLYRSTDGFSARFYVQEQFEDLFRAFFKNVSSEICGQESDVIPLPGLLRKLVVNLTPE